MLRELNVVEQRYQAVLQVLDGIPVTEVAERFGVARQTVHRWLARYRDSGIDGLADRSHAPKAHPWRISAEVEAVICDLRSSHRWWGPRRLVFELSKRGHPDVSRSTVYRALVRHQLLEPVSRRRRRDQYRRWERSASMELWQLDVTASLFLADGRECKIITGIDDHSRFCVIATVVLRATARAVCSAFVAAMAEYGIPGEVLSDNGKQFTGRFGRPRPAEVLFERICRENGITPAADQAPVADHDGEDRAAAPYTAARAPERARPVCQHRGCAGRGGHLAQAVQHRPAAPVPGDGLSRSPVHRCRLGRLGPADSGRACADA
jgi:transposase